MHVSCCTFVLLLSVYKILPWRFHAVFLLPRARTKSGWLELTKGWTWVANFSHEHVREHSYFYSMGRGSMIRSCIVRTDLSADCKRGRRKGATSKNVKNRQKVSKSFSTLFDIFRRAGQKTSKIVKKRVKNIFDTFRQFSRGTIFPAPFGGSESKRYGIFCCALLLFF